MTFVALFNAYILKKHTMIVCTRNETCLDMTERLVDECETLAAHKEFGWIVRRVTIGDPRKFSISFSIANHHTFSITRPSVKDYLCKGQVLPGVSCLHLKPFIDSSWKQWITLTTLGHVDSAAIHRTYPDHIMMDEMSQAQTFEWLHFLCQRTRILRLDNRTVNRRIAHITHFGEFSMMIAVYFLCFQETRGRSKHVWAR